MGHYYRSEKFCRRFDMTKTLTALAAAATIAIAAVAAPPQAEARGGRIAAGVIGGLALGAIAASAYGPYYGYGPAYYAPGPAYAYGPPCDWRRERFWDGYGWRIRRVRVCY
jgi:hypothetical protein